MTSLHACLDASAGRWPDRTAVEEADGSAISYRDLAALSDRVRAQLERIGVRPGDRVGLCMAKSIDAVATIFGILRAGAAYVPVDPNAPASRSGYILADCSIRAAVIEGRFEASLSAAIAAHGGEPSLLTISGTGGGRPLAAVLDAAAVDAPVARLPEPAADDLAYILYTSGSTGRPKGVQLSHRNATSFVDWCVATFAPTPEDRFSSHAPFHFDLSILDIYCAIRGGATLVLIGEEAGKNPVGLARLVADARISVWYSAPSILSLMAQSGALDTHDTPALRLVLFAGEVFPVRHLRTLMECWPRPRYFNLYGPTETNVCTLHEVAKPIPADRTEPVPIGAVCPHLEGVILGPEEAPMPAGEEGELCIRGPAVTRGYWHLPEQTARAFVTVGPGPAYYRTGDIVREEPDGNLKYLGRKDRMIKKRGFRVELGEIEACLHAHPDIKEAAVVALPDEALGMKVHAHLVTGDGGKLSVVALKTFCSQSIPVYMIPDVFAFHATLPKTSTDKVDYQRLTALSRDHGV